jgi:hypothetical protein
MSEDCWQTLDWHTFVSVGCANQMSFPQVNTPTLLTASIPDRAEREGFSDDLPAAGPVCSNCWNSSRFGHLVNEPSELAIPDWRFLTPQNRHKNNEVACQANASSKVLSGSL